MTGLFLLSDKYKWQKQNQHLKNQQPCDSFFLCVIQVCFSGIHCQHKYHQNYHQKIIYLRDTAINSLYRSGLCLKANKKSQKRFKHKIYCIQKPEQAADHLHFYYQTQLLSILSIVFA